MTEQFLFTTAKNLDQDTLAWTNQASTPISPNLSVSNNSLSDSMNEAYVTAIEENDTAYLSILEATNETTLEALHNLTLDNSKIALQDNLEGNTEHTENFHLNDSEENQVVVFTVDGSDDLFGVQLVQDDEGNIQKYQFQFRTTEQGTLEAIPETIQLLPNDDDNNEQQIVLQNEEIVESVGSENDDQFEEIDEGNQYDGENHLQNYNVETQENTNFDTVEPNQYEEHSDFNRTDFNQIREINQYSKEKRTFKVFVKNELTVKSEHHVTNDDFENDEVPENIAAEEEDIKPAMLELRESGIKEEAFNEDTSESLLQSYQQEETVEVPSIGNEETLVPEESAFVGVDIEQDETEKIVTYDTASIQSSCGMLEIQHFEPHPEQNDFSDDDSGTDSQPEVANFKRLFIEDRFSEENKIENLKQDTILQRNDEVIDQESDTETYEITHGTHVTAEGELVESIDNIYEGFSETIASTTLRPQYPPQNSNNILKPSTTESIDKGSMKTSKKQLLYYLLPHPEKENLNAVPTNNCVNIYNNCIKNNPRSVLKPQALELKLVANTNSTASQDQEAIRQLERMEKRFSRSKEAVQARLFNNFINKTTIPHAPVRQKRLPRKQEIKPVDTRREEEIIVQEVMVSSSGFVESVEERLKAKDKLEVVSYIELVDSDDENSKLSKSKKKNSKNKDGVIEILSSDEEDLIAQNSQPLKRGRGRPKKNVVTYSSLKRDREKQNKDTNSHDENSPSKKSRTESSENDSDGGKKEIICPHCPKTFPSQNSLGTHIQHHNLENRLRRTRTSLFEYKHKCEECEMVFKNSLLLSRHVCNKKKNKFTCLSQCDICKKNFKDLNALTIHSKIHNSNKALQNHQQNLPVTKKADIPVMELKKYNCEKCQSSFKNVILLKRHICQDNNVGKHRCGICKMSFENLPMFNIHKRKHVKESLIQTTIAEEPVPAKKLLSPSKKRQSLGQFNTTNKGSPSFNITKKFSCNNCGQKFASRLLLDLHTRRNCVKTPTKNASQRLSFSRQNILSSLSKTISTSLDLNAECNDCPLKFKTYTNLLKHQIKEHNYSPPAKDAIMKPKKKMIRQIKDHGAIPVHPRLRKAVEDLKTKLITPKKGGGAIEIIDEEKPCS